MGAGRPRKFKNKKELEEKIEAYFDSCFEPVLREGIPVIDPETGGFLLQQTRPYTIAGLAVFLGIDRKTLLNYSKENEYFPTVKRARDRIEAYAEEQLFTPKITAGVIFNLKNNFGWQDRQEIRQEISGLERFFVDDTDGDPG